MRVNQSDSSKSNNEFLQQWSNSLQSPASNQPSYFTFGAKGRENINPYRRTQVILAISLAVLTTLWVQITMQRHAPFIRTAQCFFNEVIFLHDSQDIYQGNDVIYWRNGESYSFQDITGIFSRLSDTLQNLDEVSMFQVPANHTKIDTQDADVDMLVMYRYDTPSRYEQIDTYNSSLEDMDEMFNKTLFNRTFYEHLWKVELSIRKPIVYRGDTLDMNLFFSGQIYSAMLMQYKLDVSILDSLSNDLQSNRQQHNSEQLGIRKLENAHNMELNAKYLKWVILLLFMAVSILEYRFLMQKNIFINEKIKQKLIEENRIQELLDKIADRVDQKGSNVDSFILNMLEEREDLGTNKDKRYTIPLDKRIKKIGFYYVLQLIVSIMAFIGYYNNHNGLICFFAWLKLLIYLAQTKNRLMFGFLFEEALPIYLKVQINILLLMTAFVLFNMLVCTASIKFETIELGYFQYLFNYFQYGIYQNFKKAFEPYGILAQFFYFCQIMLLLYIGNNILISILASQVSKNSMLQSVQQMLDEMQMKCPQCSTPFARKKGKAGQQEQYQKEKLVSKLMKELEFAKSRVQSEMSSPDGNDEEYINIVIKSPTLSPYFPRKNQKKKEEEQFMSPGLKNKNLQQRLKAIDLKLKKDEEKTTSKIQAYEQLKIKVNPPKKLPQVELAQSEIHTESNKKYLKKVKAKNELLFKAVDQLRPQKNKKDLIPEMMKNQVYSEVLNKLLGKVNQFQRQIKKTMNG